MMVDDPAIVGIVALVAAMMPLMGFAYSEREAIVAFCRKTTDDALTISSFKMCATNHTLLFGVRLPNGPSPELLSLLTATNVDSRALSASFAPRAGIC